MRLARVYDERGNPTDERIDTLSGESVYDLPFQHPVEEYECELCGLTAHEAPHWYRGRRLCEQCHNWDKALTIVEIAARKESRRWNLIGYPRQAGCKAHGAARSGAPPALGGIHPERPVSRWSPTASAKSGLPLPPSH